MRGIIKKRPLTEYTEQPCPNCAEKTKWIEALEKDREWLHSENLKLQEANAKLEAEVKNISNQLGEAIISNNKSNQELQRLTKENEILKSNLTNQQKYEVDLLDRDTIEIKRLQQAVNEAREVIGSLIIKSAGVTVRVRGKLNAGTTYSQEFLENKIMKLYDVQLVAERWLSKNNEVSNG